MCVGIRNLPGLEIDSWFYDASSANRMPKHGTES
jgi:hypothetical protein